MAVTVADKFVFREDVVSLFIEMILMSVEVVLVDFLVP